MKILSLASGSKGNACVLEHEGVTLSIDCGVPLKRFHGIDLDAVLITHSHADHVSGLRVLLNRFDVPVYANLMTAESIAHDCGIDDSAFVCFENSQPFEIGPFSVLPFSVPHDTSDPVGYLIRAGGTTYFHGTDIGMPLDSIGELFAEADVAVLESNHDAVMLCRSGRPEHLIRRIAGPRGHLSNDQACELVGRFASPKLKRLALAHLSRDCNAPHLAEAAMRDALRKLRRSDVALKILSQDEPLEI